MLLLTTWLSANSSAITATAPMKAPIVTAKKPPKCSVVSLSGRSVPPTLMTPPRSNITSATPRLAPLVMPRMEGPASGLRKEVCNNSPDVAREAPHRRAVNACGRRASSTMYAQISCSTPIPASARSTCATGMLTGPATRLTAVSNRVISDNNMFMVKPLLIILLMERIGVTHDLCMAWP